MSYPDLEMLEEPHHSATLLQPVQTRRTLFDELISDLIDVDSEPESIILLD